MGYRKAEEILPVELIQLIQQYVDGESIYIPRQSGSRQKWGQSTRIRQELNLRNSRIHKDFQIGLGVNELAEKYFLSTKSIQRILREWNNMMIPGSKGHAFHACMKQHDFETRKT